MIIIGEKINGAIPSVARAIQERNGSFISELAKKQSDAGADYLDICAGVTPELEKDALEWLVETVEKTVDTPICIDSPNVHMIADILPKIKKEGIVNSVSAETGKCEVIYPLIADTNWKVIALTCSDEGIPSGAMKKAR